MRSLAPLLWTITLFLCSCSPPRHRSLIIADDFQNGLSNWSIELEKGGTVRASDGALDIDVPAGCTVWLKTHLNAPLAIEYAITAVSAGGPNDRVSDLNCFWMATDTRSPRDLFATPRSGKFSDYDQLNCYYASLGGNANTTTRFRRYIGQPNNRPLLPHHDLKDPRYLITPNIPYQIRITSTDRLIRFYRDGEKLFQLDDAKPYTHGHFAFRTVSNHMRIHRFRVLKLPPSEAHKKAQLPQSSCAD